MDKKDFTYAINRFTGEYEIMYLREIGQPYYLYIVEEVEGRYGPQLLAAVDGMTTIYALPTIRAFLDGLSVDKYYKIMYLGEHELDNGYTKHEYNIIRIPEEVYMNEAEENFNDKKY